MNTMNHADYVVLVHVLNWLGTTCAQQMLAASLLPAKAAKTAKSGANGANDCVAIDCVFAGSGIPIGQIVVRLYNNNKNKFKISKLLLQRIYTAIDAMLISLPAEHPAKPMVCKHFLATVGHGGKMLDEFACQLDEQTMRLADQYNNNLPQWLQACKQHKAAQMAGQTASQTASQAAGPARDQMTKLAAQLAATPLIAMTNYTAPALMSTQHNIRTHAQHVQNVLDDFAALGMHSSCQAYKQIVQQFVKHQHVRQAGSLFGQVMKLVAICVHRIWNHSCYDAVAARYMLARLCRTEHDAMLALPSWLLRQMVVIGTGSTGSTGNTARKYVVDTVVRAVRLTQPLDMWTSNLAQTLLLRADEQTLGQLAGVLGTGSINNNFCSKVRLVIQKAGRHVVQIVCDMCCSHHNAERASKLAIDAGVLDCLHGPDIFYTTSGPGMRKHHVRLASWLAQHQPAAFYHAGLAGALMQSCEGCEGCEGCEDCAGHAAQHPLLVHDDIAAIQKYQLEGLEALLSVSDEVFRTSVARFASHCMAGCDADQMVRLMCKCLEGNHMARRAVLSSFLKQIAWYFTPLIGDDEDVDHYAHTMNMHVVKCGKVLLGVLQHVKPGSQHSDWAFAPRMQRLVQVVHALADEVAEWAHYVDFVDLCAYLAELKTFLAGPAQLAQPSQPSKPCQPSQPSKPSKRAVDDRADRAGPDNQTSATKRTKRTK